MGIDKFYAVKARGGGREEVKEVTVEVETVVVQPVWQILLYSIYC